MYQVIGILFLLINACGCIHAHDKSKDADFGHNVAPSPVKGAIKTAILKGYLNTIPESSGLMYTSGCLWTFEDSGNNPWIYSIDTANASVIQTVIIDNFPNTDWEDIAADANNIYIGDFGNNDGTRTDLKVLKISKSDISNKQFVHVKAKAIKFSYLDQTMFTANNETNFDCESLISKGDSLYLFTKNHGDYKTRVYALPKHKGSYQVAPIATYDVDGMVCGADYDIKTNKVVLIGHKDHKINSFLLLLYGFHGNNFFAGNKEHITIGNNYTEWQTEGVSFVNSSHIFISCESTENVPASLYTYDLPQKAITAIPDISIPKVVCFPNPAKNYLEIRNEEPMQKIILYNLHGQQVFRTTLNQSSYNLKLNGLNLPTGVYLLEIHSAGKIRKLKVEINK